MAYKCPPVTSLQVDHHHPELCKYAQRYIDIAIDIFQAYLIARLLLSLLSWMCIPLESFYIQHIERGSSLGYIIDWHHIIKL